VAIHAQAVEILVTKARFEPEVALGVAEAMEVSMTLAQLVTVPVLDARLQELRYEIEVSLEKTKAELVRWVFLTMLGNVALGAVASQLVKAFSN
jgi:hypothetical protein